MPAMEALKAATMVPAQILGEEANMGSVERGKSDLIVTDENALQNIKTLQNVIFVIKDRVMVKQ